MEMKCDSHGWVQARHFCHKCVADYLTRIAKLEAEGGLMAEHTALQQTLPWSIAGSSRMYQGTLAIVDRNNQNVLWAAGFDGDDGCDCCVGGDALGLAVVRAVNCHKALVRELEDCELSLKLDVDEWGSPRLKGTLANIRAALAKAKESRLQQQDLDEETL